MHFLKIISVAIIRIDNVMVAKLKYLGETVINFMDISNQNTHFSPPSCCVISLASVACSDISLANADDVFPLAMFSNNRPKEINISSKGGVSKNVIGTSLVYVAPTIITVTLFNSNNYMTLYCEYTNNTP